MSTIIVKDSAGLTAALKAAQGGDVIKLAAGDYSAMNLSGLKFTSQVTVTSLDQGNPAALNGLILRDSQNIKFENLELKVDGAKADYPYQVYGCKDITLNKLDVHGSMDNNDANDVAGLMIRDSSNVTLSNSEFQSLRHGVAHLDSGNLKIVGNYFHDIRTDGVRGGGSSNVEVSGNYFTDFHPEEGDHADAIQFWTTNTTKSATNIVVNDNVVLRGDGEPIQGIFFRDQVGDVPFINVQVTNNLVVGAAFNAISANGAKDITISGNTVTALPDQASRILLVESDGVKLTGNTATQILFDDLTKNVVQSGNVVVAVPSDGGAAVQAAWLVKNAGLTVGVIDQTLTAQTSDGFVNAGKLTASILATQANAALREIDAARSVMVKVKGTSGNDQLKVSATQDTHVEAGDGNDIIYGGGVGHNTLSGGAGDDTYYVKSTYDQVVEGANSGVDTVVSTVDFVLSDHIEHLRLMGEAFAGEGNGLDNKITGTDGANDLRGHGGNDLIQSLGGDDRVYGGSGNDTIQGGDGNDTLAGEAGSDNLKGGEGSDALKGGDGADTLEGGAGADTLSGGAGADMFIYREGDLSLNGDRILDFNRLEGDKISLQSIDANVYVGGDQRFAFIGSDSFRKVAGELRMETSANGVTLSGDTNGDGIADFQLMILPGQTLTAADLIL